MVVAISGMAKKPKNQKKIDKLALEILFYYLNHLHHSLSITPSFPDSTIVPT